MTNDPNAEWLGHVQPIGLVVSPNVLTEHGLVPADQTRADSDDYAALLTETGPALKDPWQLASLVLEWPASLVAGAPGGPALPEGELRAYVPEAETELAPDWAVAKPGGGWQMLVQRLPLGIEPDKRGALQGWEATPHQRLERLLRETGVPIGLLIADEHWRLVYAPRGETSGHITFPLRPMGLVAGRPMLGGFKLLLDRTRLFTDAPNRRLPAILAASRDAQASVSTALAGQVLGALHELLRGLHAADPDRLACLARQRPQEVYEGLLTVLLRLIFLLYAEDRDLIPSRTDPAARVLYHRSYGVRGLHARLRHDAARNPDTMNERYGAWGQLLATFKLVHAGDGTGWISGRGGDLFDPRRFRFLQGQDVENDPVVVPKISDGAVLRVLDGLMVLKGERLSYRTLDVEQIGSVYETVMGFTVQPAPGPCLAIRAGKNNRTPVFVDLADLTAHKGKDRIKALKEDYARGQLTATLAKAVEAATSVHAMGEALRPIVDERASPGGEIASSGTPILQPTDERRRTGSHYTPRTLTNPIVQHALQPAFDRIGPDATPDQVLALKVCDPAMGSGAFLVEACRQLASRLVAAWARHPGTRPPIPADEDEDLLARRLVAQRCLYGVDRNPLATDLARLSLWLATLAREHEFTFLDHALKSGDSLVGLTRAQIGSLTWDDGRQGRLISKFVRERVAEAVAARTEIREAPDDIARDLQEGRHRVLERRIADVRTLGDAILACFFEHDKPRSREAARQALAALPGGTEAMWTQARLLAVGLGSGTHPIRPFHAIVGNPPFAGKNTLINGHRAHYLDWLQTLHEGAHGNADLVAHFFRRAFALLRPGGCLGLIATNTIGQGDTRQSGLRALVAGGGTIARAVRRFAWPGEASVVVSIVHIVRGSFESPTLDDRPVRRVSAFLMEGDVDNNPAPLVANAKRAFVGMFLLGAGFTFDDEAAAKGKATPIDEMHRLIAKDARNAERIVPYLGGEEVNTDPLHRNRRWCIDFDDFPLRRVALGHDWEEMDAQQKAACLQKGDVPLDYPGPVAADWPDLLAIVERLVKPERSRNKDKRRREVWWQHTRRVPSLRKALGECSEVLLIGIGVISHLAFAFRQERAIYAHTLGVIIRPDLCTFGLLQSRVHEVWAQLLSSSFGDGMRYTPSDCLETFPFPMREAAHASSLSTGLLGDAALEYRDYRSFVMLDRDEGLTKLYNRFHEEAEKSQDIEYLRLLHHRLDLATLKCYGWDDLAAIASPDFLTEETEQDHRYQGRLFWPAPFRDEVLARLLALNAERAAEEKRAGLTPVCGDDEAVDTDLMVAQ